MNISSWKRFLTLALALAIATPSFGDTESLVLRTKAGPLNPASQISVTSIPFEDQDELLIELVKNLKADPKSAAIVATTGEDDSLAGALSLSELYQSKQVVAVQAKSLQDIPAPTKKAREYRNKILNSKIVTSVNEQKGGILISVIPAGNYGALVYFMSADFVMATASFGVVLGLNAFQAIFTKQWLQFASLGDKGMRVVAKAIGDVSGKPIRESVSARMGNLGRVGWTTAMNTAVASITMTLSGTLDSAWALLYFGFSSSYDLWDQVLEEKLQKSKFFSKYFINTRLAIGSFLECAALAGLAFAEFGLVAATVAGAMALIFKPVKKVIDPVTGTMEPVALKPKLIDRIKVSVAKFASVFKRAPAEVSKPYFPCDYMLVRAM